MTGGGDMTDFLRLADRLADAAAAVILKHYRTDFDLERKADETPVTIADRDAEKAMRALIEDAYPGHGIIGEEFPDKTPDAEYVWVLDPIDGTKSFVTGKPLFGTLIALARNGRPVLGIINAPAMGERFAGGEGHPATLNGRPIKTRDIGALADAWLYSTSPHLFSAPGDLAAFDRLRGAVHQTIYGGDCYAYGLLSLGTVDLVCEAELGTYDYAALAPVVEAAGGVITDWQGQPLTLNSDGRVLAAGSQAVHAAALAALHG